MSATCTKVSIDKLMVDGRYQRPLDEKRVSKIVDSYDENLLGTLELSERKNGTLAIIDGQHRFAALKRVGATECPALVHKDLTIKEEADLFARTNMGRKPLSPIQRFKAQVFSGDEQAVDIQKLVTEAGFRIDYTETSGELGTLRSIVAIEKAYGTFGRDHVKQMLETIRDLWFGERAATDAILVRGVSAFLSVYGENLTSEHIERLGRTPAIAIVRRAKEKSLSGSSTSLAALIADDIRRLAGLRTATPKGTKQVSEDEQFERQLAAV